MKTLGWIAFLVAIALGLVIYNIKYLPMQDELIRLQNENKMWQNQIKELQNRLVAEKESSLVLIQSYSWDELFVEITSFNLTEPAQVMLKELIPRLQQSSGEILINSYCPKQTLPSELKSRYSNERELSFAKALAVLNFLASWGVNDEQLVAIGYGASRPRVITNNQSSDNKARIEIIVK